MQSYQEMAALADAQAAENEQLRTELLDWQNTTQALHGEMSILRVRTEKAETAITRVVELLLDRPADRTATDLALDIAAALAGER